MSNRLNALLTLLLPIAWLSAAELVLTIISAGSDRPYVARLGGRILLAELLLAVVVALAWSFIFPGGKSSSARRRLALACGLSVTLGTLTVLANGLPRKVPPGTLPTAAAWGIALALGLGAMLLRRALARRDGTGMALLYEPLLIAVVMIGGYGLLRLRRLPPATLTGAAIWMVLGAAGLLAGLLLSRLPPRPSRWAILFLPVILATTLGGLAVLLGRTPFPLLPPRSSGPPDLLLVVLDTTRADFAPAASDSAWPTPGLARIAAEGQTFSSCFSTSCWTVPAHASLFTGRLPAAHGTTWNQPHLPEDLPTLAQRLAQAGWRTAGFSANPWIGPAFGFDRGFDLFLEVNADHRPLRPWATAFLPSRLTAPALDLFDDKGGLTLASEALRHLAGDHGRPVFTFLNLLEPHLPYLPPRRFRNQVAAAGWSLSRIHALDQNPLAGLAGSAVADDDTRLLRTLYAAEVAYADSLLARILERLSRSGRLDHTIIVVTSDHGENLNDHAPLDHQLGLYDTLVHVPLLIRYPAGVPAGSTENGLVSLASIPRRILQLAGVLPGTDEAGAQAPPAGRVYFQYARPDPVLDRVRSRLGLDPSPWDRSLDGIRSEDHKWIRSSDGHHMAFDLEADPLEQHNLFHAGMTDEEPWSRLAASLEQRLPAGAAAGTGSPSLEMSPEIRQRLRSLGYLD